MEYVYKTQGTCSTNIELNVEDGVVKEVAFWGAVSYTHLDVYKRQVIELFFYFSDNGVLREDTRFEVID